MRVLLGFALATALFGSELASRDEELRLERVQAARFAAAIAECANNGYFAIGEQEIMCKRIRP